MDRIWGWGSRGWQARAGGRAGAFGLRSSVSCGGVGGVRLNPKHINPSHSFVRPFYCFYHQCLGLGTVSCLYSLLWVVGVVRLSRSGPVDRGRRIGCWGTHAPAAGGLVGARIWMACHRGGSFAGEDRCAISVGFGWEVWVARESPARVCGQ